eukprot:COSAG02_NODE_15105_length_1203_cov_1.472826_2_plen_54_part_01
METPPCLASESRYFPPRVLLMDQWVYPKLPSLVQLVQNYPDLRVTGRCTSSPTL